MQAAWSGAYLLILLLIGFTLAQCILGRDHARGMIEMAGLTLILGLGATASELLLLSLLGLKPDRTILLISGAAAVGVLTFMWRIRRLSAVSVPQLCRREMLAMIPPLLILVIGLIIVSIIAMAFPIFDWDAMVIWGFKAKVLYYSPLTPRPWYFTEVRYSYSHLDYPLLMPMSLAGDYAMMRQVSEQPARMIFPLMLLGQMLIVYSGARMLISRLASLYITALVCCAPFAIQQAGIGVADLHLATFHAAAVVYLLRWSIHRRRNDAILASLFALFTMLAKAEGLPLAGITGIVLIAIAASKAPRNRETRISLAAFLTILLLGVGIWIAWRSGIPHTDENYLRRLRPSVLLGNASRIGLILLEMTRRMLSVRDFGGLWMLLPIFALLGRAAFARPQARLLWTMLILHLTIYAIAYVITPWDARDLINVSMNRLLTHVAPTAGLIIAAHWSAIAGTASKNAMVTVDSSLPRL